MPLIVLPFLGGGNAMHALKTYASQNTGAQARRKLSSMVRGVLDYPRPSFDPCGQFQGAASGLRHLHHHKPPIIHGDIHPVSKPAKCSAYYLISFIG